MLGTIVLIILIVDLVFTSLIGFAYFSNKKHYDKVRKESISILEPLIETTVLRKDRVFRKKIVFDNVAAIKAYQQQLIKECLAEMISELSREPRFSVQEVEYDEVEYRLKAYVYNHIHIEVDREYQKQNPNNEKTNTATIDIGTDLSNIYN